MTKWGIRKMVIRHTNNIIYNIIDMKKKEKRMEFNAKELEIIIKFSKWIDEHLDKNFEVYSSYIKDKRDGYEYETAHTCLDLETIITLYAKEYYEKNNRKS